MSLDTAAKILKAERDIVLEAASEGTRECTALQKYSLASLTVDWRSGWIRAL